MKLGKTTAILGLAGALAAVVVAGTALAQTPTPTQTPSQQAKANYHDFFLDRLAAALGVARDQLNGAITQARNETVDQQVKDGRITQERADAIKARPSDGFIGPWGFGPHRIGPRGGIGPVTKIGAHLDVVAQALGMTTQELISQLRSGKTLSELAAGKEQAVKDAVAAAAKTKLDRAVAAGRITQEQENQTLDRIRNSDLNQLLHGFGGRGGFKIVPKQTPTPAPGGQSSSSDGSFGVSAF